MRFFKFIRAMFTPVPRLSPADCADRIRSGQAILIDVREPGEWDRGVAKHAALLPLSDLNGPRHHWKPVLEKATDRELVLYCAVGGRATIAAKLLAVEGFRAANGGGLADWAAAGWPTEYPPKH